MKTKSLLLWGTAFLLLTAATAQADDRVEVQVQGAYSPTKGFDDNDNVQVVLHGSLLNACYTIAEPTADVNPQSKVVTVHQYAFHKTDGVCASEINLPAHMQMMVPFTTTLNVGQLAMGDYKIAFINDLGTGAIETRNLNVIKSEVPTVDSQTYAIVTNIESSDFFGPTDKIKFNIRGMLNTPCVTIDEDKTKVLDQGDVFVVLPVTKVIPGADCADVLVPFKKSFKLDKASVGHHLIHARSLNGQSVNRIVEVVAVQ